MPKRFNPQDGFFRKAKQDGLRARSAYKLEEILKKFPDFLPKNKVILDLGCAPGSFLQILSRAQPKKLIGVDLQHTDPISGVTLLQGDIFSEEVEKILLQESPFHVITSDMAPKTSGISDADQFHSVKLCERVLSLSEKILPPNGNLLLKIFVGEDFDAFWKIFRARFRKAKVFKPDASRDRSRETFLIGIAFLPQKRDVEK
ncbi:RlmE family RNA methyltransferase [Candidatus Peregrinibacteria bacterium]|nr:MAG: RlmE family RNA methyltransferase [Candidatus Peregrinibacteria bacterium]